MNTRVFSSSIFFIADSVVSGNLMVRNLSMSGCFGTDVRGYIGLRACFNVFGRKKWTFLRILLCFFVIAFFATLAAVCAFATLAAFSAGFLAGGAGFGASFAAALGAGAVLGAAAFLPTSPERELE